MKKCLPTVVAMIGVFGVAGAAQAGSVIIDAVGGPITLRSGDVSDLFSAGGLNDFTTPENKDLCDALSADGVVTDGMVTFLLADTADGLSFITLVDDATIGGDSGDLSTLGMSSTAPSSTEYWINDLGFDILDIDDPFGINTTASGTFEWGENRGDAFAWSNLQDGDGVTFNFEEMESGALVEGEPFQFVTWNGDAWEVVETAGWSNMAAIGQFAFSFVTIVPLPAPVLLGLAGLAGVAAYRRRRMIAA